MSVSLVYVASPFRNVEQRLAACIARQACREVMSISSNLYPISPVLMWGGLKDEKTYKQREENLKACKLLLEKCEYIYVAKSDYSEFSEGIKEELKLASKIGINELKV